jgi:hypothetical protein
MEYRKIGKTEIQASIIERLNATVLIVFLVANAKANVRLAYR